MSVYDLPFCDVCGYPYHNGLPTCDCGDPGAVSLAQENRDDEAVVEHCSKLKSSCSWPT